MNKRTLSICGAAMFLSLLVSSSWGYEKEIEQLSSQMAEKIAGKGKKTVAVVDFTDLEGKVTQLDQFIAEEFSVALASAGKGFRVIDRTRLMSIIKENKLAATGLIDPATASKLGKIAGVDALVTGTLTPFGDNVRLTVKVLDSETADIIDSAKSNFAKTQAIDELLGKEVETATQAIDSAKKTETKKDKGGNSGAFSDDFNAGPKPDWKPISGNWTMSNGQYTVTDIANQARYIAYIDGKKWNNIVVDLDITPGDTGNRNYPEMRASICPMMINLEEKVCFGLSGFHGQFNEAYWYISKKDAKDERISREKIETLNEQPVHIKLEVQHGVFTAYVNNMKVNQVYDATFKFGTLSLIQWYEWWDYKEAHRITFDNLEIKPLAD